MTPNIKRGSVKLPFFLNFFIKAFTKKIKVVQLIHKCANVFVKRLPK